MPKRSDRVPFIADLVVTTKRQGRITLIVYSIVITLSYWLTAASVTLGGLFLNLLALPLYVMAFLCIRTLFERRKADQQLTTTHDPRITVRQVGTRIGVDATPSDDPSGLGAEVERQIQAEAEAEAQEVLDRHKL